MKLDGTEVSMSGRAATNPSISGSKSDRVSFRAVSTERRYDEAAGEWVDGDEFWATIVCWRQLGSSVLQLVRKGDPVVVLGRISTRKYEKEGATDYFTEIKADHVALDVARAGGRVKRVDSWATPETDTDHNAGAGAEQAEAEAVNHSDQPVATGDSSPPGADADGRVAAVA